MFASVDSKLAPCSEESFTHFSYAENINTGEVVPPSGSYHKKSIVNALLGQLRDPYTVLSLK